MGDKRIIDDAAGNVTGLVEAIKRGFGTPPQANQRRDFGVGEGLPPENLQPVMGGEGRPQHPGGTFLGG